MSISIRKSSDSRRNERLTMASRSSGSIFTRALTSSVPVAVRPIRSALRIGSADKSVRLTHIDFPLPVKAHFKWPMPAFFSLNASRRLTDRSVSSLSESIGFGEEIFTAAFKPA